MLHPEERIEGGRNAGFSTPLFLLPFLFTFRPRQQVSTWLTLHPPSRRRRTKRPPIRLKGNFKFSHFQSSRHTQKFRCMYSKERRLEIILHHWSPPLPSPGRK